MKGLSRLLTLLLASTLIFASCSTPTATPQLSSDEATTASAITEQDAVTLAEKFFQALVVEEDFASAMHDFDSAMLDALPESRLKEIWESLPLQFGAYQERLAVQTVEHVDQYLRVVITLKFERGALDMRVVVDSTTGLISGLFFAPSQDAAQLYETPDYAAPDSFHEREVTIGSGEWKLPGTLTMPNGQGPFPAVVLVHGSGPNDRDETVGANKPFKDLAWGLATRGIAVLRHDKRTKVYSDRFASMENGFTVKEETIDDAVAAVSLLRQTDGIDAERIFVLGHSLGGMLAPRIARADSEIAGLIIMAGATRPLEDLIIEQTQYILSLSGDVSAQEQRQFDAIQREVESIKALNPSNASDKESLLGAPPQYWIDLQGYDPAALASTLTQPMLILQGERDYQVTMTDFLGWMSALSNRSDVLLKSYPELNHLFITGTGQSTPDEYQAPGNIAAIVIDDLVNWISEQP